MDIGAQQIVVVHCRGAEVSEKGEMSLDSLVEIGNLVIRLQVKMRSKVRRHISLHDSSDLEGCWQRCSQ